MKREINFQVFDKTQMKERVIAYFTRSGFKFSGTDGDQLKFIHGSSFFDTWTTNPLKWGCEIIISFNDNNVSAEFCIDTESQMNSLEEESIWNDFIENFRSFLMDRKDLNFISKTKIANVKNSRLVYVGWAIFGVIVGGIIGMFLSRLTGSKMTAYFIIPITATLFLSRSINYRREKNAL